jgi:hypothetical protein
MAVAAHGLNGASSAAGPQPMPSGARIRHRHDRAGVETGGEAEGRREAKCSAESSTSKPLMSSARRDR